MDPNVSNLSDGVADADGARKNGGTAGVATYSGDGMTVGGWDRKRVGHWLPVDLEGGLNQGGTESTNVVPNVSNLSDVVVDVDGGRKNVDGVDVATYSGDGVQVGGGVRKHSLASPIVLDYFSQSNERKRKKKTIEKSLFGQYLDLSSMYEEVVEVNQSSCCNALEGTTNVGTAAGCISKDQGSEDGNNYSWDYPVFCIEIPRPSWGQAPKHVRDDLMKKGPWNQLRLRHMERVYLLPQAVEGTKMTFPRLSIYLTDRFSAGR